MVGSASALLAEAELLSRQFAYERSTELKPISDDGLGMVVPSWRTNNPQPEHALHSLMSRVGSFPPGLARYFLALYSRPGDLVLDPFCGKGTALFEASVLGRVAIGGDISPDAVVCARGKSCPLPTVKVIRYIEDLKLSNTFPISGVPSSISLFYNKRTLSQIVNLKERLALDTQNRSRRDVATFVCGILLGLLHGHSQWSLSLPCNHAFGMSPKYVLRYAKEHKLVRPDKDVQKCLLNRALEVLPFPKKMQKVAIVEAPAHKCNEYIGLFGRKATLVITSPPYMDRQTYIKDSWMRLWFLNRSRQEVAKHSLETSSVSNFVQSMTSVMSAISLSLKKDGVVVMVCGKAFAEVGGERRGVRIGELCLLANEGLGKGRLVPERLIVDRKMMKRGAYFAVHHGKGPNRDVIGRYGEDEILVLRKT